MGDARYKFRAKPVVDVPPPTALRRVLDDRGLRIDWVAARAGISPSHLSNLVDGRRTTSAPVALAIAAVLDLSVGDLFFWDHRPESS